MLIDHLISLNILTKLLLQFSKNGDIKRINETLNERDVLVDKIRESKHSYLKYNSAEQYHVEKIFSDISKTEKEIEVNLKNTQKGYSKSLREIREKKKTLYIYI